MLRRRIFLAASLGAVIAPATGTHAREQAPVRASLRVGWRDRGGVGRHERMFDLTALESLDQTTVVTGTPWFEGRTTFLGARASRLVELLGSDAKMARMTALNDYVVEIPVSDFTEFGTIIALKRDGHYMPVSDKGPFFVIYPYDDAPKLQQRLYYSRSIWQLSSIELL